VPQLGKYLVATTGEEHAAKCQSNNVQTMEAQPKEKLMARLKMNPQNMAHK